MYNDYYLEQINSKLSSTNSLIDDIIDNQEIIKTQNQTLISGDQEIIERLEYLNNSNIVICLALSMFMLFYFIDRCLK